MSKSVVVDSTVALWFRIARVFAMAPVSIRSERDGYRVSACTFCAVYGYILGVIYSICYIGYVYNVFRIASAQDYDRWLWIWVLDYGISASILVSVTAGGARQQSAMISDLIQLDKITSQVDSCYADKVKHGRQNTYVMFGVLTSYLLMHIRVAKGLRFLGTLQFQCFSGVVQFGYYFLFAVKLRNIILNMEIRNSLHIINEELLRLYDMIGSDIELTSQVFAWSLSRRLRVLCHSYWSTIAIYRRGNKSNEIKTIVIFFLHAFRLTVSLYLIVIHVTLGDKHKQMKQNIPFILTLTAISVSQLAEMIHFTETYESIYNEVEKTCATLKRFRKRADAFGKKVVKHLNIFVDLALENVYCSPLGICTIKNSLVATTITAIATCLTVVFQFHTNRSN